MNEIIEKQYEYILSIIEMDDFNNVSDMELNVIVYKAVEVWKRLVKNDFTINNPNSDMLKATFGNYQKLLENVISYAYNIFMHNENNRIAKYICSYLRNESHRDVNVSELVNELHTSIQEGKTR